MTSFPVRIWPYCTAPPWISAHALYNRCASYHFDKGYLQSHENPFLLLLDEIVFSSCTIPTVIIVYRWWSMSLSHNPFFTQAETLPGLHCFRNIDQPSFSNRSWGFRENSGNHHDHWGQFRVKLQGSPQSKRNHCLLSHRPGSSQMIAICCPAVGISIAWLSCITWKQSTDD